VALVFQYGSNCSESQINSNDRLRGDARFIGRAETVEDFVLAFDVWSTKRDCAAADIVSKPGSKVWGALYEVPDYLIKRNAARRSMDAIEGPRYKRYMIEVRQDNDEVVTALTYRVIAANPALKTSLEYVGHIVNGLRERRVPEAYIAEVKEIAAVNNPTIASQVKSL
jgi:gamma-glutamylcyclotransferase (GGCT)/AIG2-like uncharacterized protein YtfP